ncbi:leucine-rich repeat receptor-like protein kinase PXC2 [Syzygium oleosum]|uniref:leucine-rich repeat receptor-like protein kinase PXC2 n=1 Tax=Syzygium oleosum TaxID=219896 RepID=UPI0011D25745|nr:leucine-rich repeat receptor-like protein kinase PXC2 [Syzygium oleosum]
MVFRVFLLLLFAPIFAQSLDAVFNDDVLGLIVFKAGLHDPKDKLSSWNEDAEYPCDWVGIKCDPRSNRVTEVALDGFSLSGHIGRGLLRLQFLQVLSLSKNNFSGPINPSLTNIGTLQVLELSENNFTGSIPDEMFQQCGSLRVVSFAKNSLMGRIPDSLSYCSTLVAVNFSSNQLSGKLPLGMWFSRGLQSLDLSENLLEAEIPEGIQNLYDVRVVNLRRNRFTGNIPGDIGGNLLLRFLDLSENLFSGNLPESMQGLGLCSSLDVHGNLLTGEIPDWIGELRSLENLDLSGNKLSGSIPPSIGNIQLLKKLNLSTNLLTGSLPDSISNCKNLSILDVSQNLLTGGFPFKLDTGGVSLLGNGVDKRAEYTSLPATSLYNNLRVMDISSNALSGEIPADLGILSSVESLNMSRNLFFGSIPASIGVLKYTQFLDLSNNRLNGSIPPGIGEAISLKNLKLDKNFLSGNIPPQIGTCSNLTSLILSQNNLTGPVPPSMANLTNLEYVDFSLNNLSGSLPKELANLSHLLYFNISHNHLEGELPVGGFFNTIPLASVSDNPSLCGSVVNDSCPSVHPKPIVLNPNSSNPAGAASSSNHRHKRIILSISSLIAIGAAAFIAIGVITITLLNIHVRSSMAHSAPALTLSGGEDFSCSPTADPNYGKLVMFSGDANFVMGAHALLNKDSELGRGGFGVVYRAVLRDGRSVAIKKLTASGLMKSQDDFEREVKTVGKIQHPNLVKLEGYYWTPSLQLLIYQFVPSGSLYKHLHDADESNSLTWRQRFNIVLGMAKGLSYLHQMGVVHYNLKSTNVLLDGSGDAKVGDFGLARLLPMLDRCILSSKIQSALGYMAPEFACRTVKITEKCDVYGFGILVLEVITGRRPVEYMEDDVVVLCDMVRGALEESKVEKCIDGRLGGSFPPEEAIPVIKLGLICASQVPSNRPDMSEVINILELIQCPSEGQEEIQ